MASSIKSIFILCIIIGLIFNISFNPSFAKDELNIQSDTSKIHSVVVLDSNNTIDSKEIVSSSNFTNYYPISKFTFAGTRRFIIDGSLPMEETELNTIPSLIVGGLITSAVAFLYIHQRNTWWSSSRGKFHFTEDWVYALQVDKIGHAYGAYLCSHVATEGLLVSGVSANTAHIAGTALGLGYQTYIEVEDGFAHDWGFCPSDFYFDVAGATLYLSQWFIPVMQNFTLKWQYTDAAWLDKPVMKRERNFLDDYNSSTFWMSINVHNLLAEKYKKYWPSWLNLAVGFGADAIDADVVPNGPPDQLIHRRYVIGFDYNFVELLPDGIPFWMWIKQSLNYFKLPAPAIEITENGVKFFMIYPFDIVKLISKIK
jgi:hypothetical protein